MNRKVKSLLVLYGIRNLDIAKKANVSETWVSLVVCGHRPGKRIRRVIVNALGLSYKEVWGEDEERVA